MRHALFLGLFLASPALADFPETVSQHILPGYAAFASATADLAQKAEGSCDPAALRPAFQSAFDAWLGVQHLHFGPSEANGTGLAIEYWPDPKGSGAKAQRGLLTGDPAALEPQRFAQQSVAARGLSGLERLLYPAAPLPADPCPLIRATALDLARIAALINDTWISSYAQTVLSAGEAGNTTFLTRPEVRQTLFTQIITALEFLESDRLGRPLGTFDKPRPERAESVILLTGHGDVPMAVAALKAGAWDFLTKPASVDDLTAALRRAVQARALVMENRHLRALRPEPASDHPQLLGDSAVMVHLRQTIARVAEAGVDALITGPIGAGKEAVARALHAHGAQRARPFVHVVCAALDPARFEAEFFGQAPNGPRGGRIPGVLEKAQRGTLFLDGIDMLPAPLQARLLAILGAEAFAPVGTSAQRPMGMRILASSSVDLTAQVAAGGFRSDLFYRLSGIVIQVPPLTARREDLPGLFRRFLLAECHRLDLPVPIISGAVQARLSGHDWPGNLRELQQFAEATALGLSAPVFLPDGVGEGQVGLSEQVADYEAELIRAALRAAQGSVVAAMHGLRLPRKTLYDKMARHGIDPEAFRPASKPRG